MRIFLIILFGILLTTSSIAQTNTDSLSIEDDTTQLKSKKIARNIALVSTLGGGLLIPPLGLIVGPVAGSIYAKNYGAVIGGVATTLVIGGLVVTAFVIAVPLMLSESDLYNFAEGVIFIGAALYVANAVSHIFFIGPKSVEKYNTKKSRTTSIAIGPSIIPSYEQLTPSLAIKLSF